jgi:hypothetical protein
MIDEDEEGLIVSDGFHGNSVDFFPFSSGKLKVFQLLENVMILEINCY